MCDNRETPPPDVPAGDAASRPSGRVRPRLPPRDTQQHGTTSLSDGSRSEVCETTIWVFRDPRKTKVSIYHGFEGLPWAIADLVRKTNSAIGRGEVPGQTLSVGDVVQACVVSYYDGEVHKPQTTADSPRYATLPYRIVRAEGGYVSAEPAVPPQTVVHFNIPATVGELIPNLDEDTRREVMVSLQLKEAAHSSERAIQEGVEDAVRSREASYAVSEKADEEANAFFGFMADEGRRDDTPARPEAPPSGPAADGERRVRRMSERLQKRPEDREDFGFSDE
jgi:hypothetical protein